ncbi:hypothetical protein J2Y48_000473 [Mycoplana sp. BE70]|uniref:YcbK family protein n=1 Tax=Mycoplana sp. BE70 TaxID=2817775 RepID=UPI00285F8CDB|nr:D-Ala-D-Ala carboxypeptidase family metallohydrolase [Mycoplana sp. BE70]MDR6755200.1 hypothetical protein [Mycoplana sp. BE70]
MAREPIREISAPSAIQGVAQPVNNYVRPAEPAPSSLHALAEGMAEFDRGLGAFMEKRRAKTDEADKIRAEALFNKNNSMGWAEAVRQGKVPAHASPIFMQSYKSAQGNLAGIQLRDKFTQEYLQWGGRNANDPAAFQTFLSDFVARNVQSDDPDVLRGLNPHVQVLTSDAYATFSSESAKSVYGGAVTTRAAIVNRTVDAANSAGLGSGTGTDYGALWADIEQQRRESLAAGIRKEDLDRELVATLTTKAVELRDPAILDLLDRTLEGDTVALKDYPDYRDMKADAIIKLETIGRQQMVDRDRTQEKRDKEREAELTVGATRLLASDPNAEIPEPLIKELEKYNPKARKELAEIRKSLGEAGVYEDPRRILELNREVAEGATREDILHAARIGQIRSPQTLTTLLDRAEKYQKARREGGGILTGQTARRFTKTITERTGPTDDGLPILDAFGNSAITDEGLEAIQDFEAALMRWEDENPDASLIEREEFTNKIGEMILGRINVEAPPTYASKYVGEADMAREAAAKAQEAADRETTRNLPEAGNGTDGGPEFYSGDEPPLLDTLPQNYQKLIEERAADLDVTPEEYNGVLWRRARKNMNQDGQPEVPQGAQDGGLVVPDEQGDIGPDLENWGEELGGLIDRAVSTPRRAPEAPRGLAALVPSSRRGRAPDLDNLKPELKAGIGALQEAWGQELPIVSGFRDAKRNRKAGGAKKSQHMHGNAVDIDVSHLSHDQRLDLIRLASRQGFTGIGVYDNSLHLDYGARRAWGPSYHAESVPQWAQASIAEHLQGQL